MACSNVYQNCIYWPVPLQESIAKCVTEKTVTPNWLAESQTMFWSLLYLVYPGKTPGIFCHRRCCNKHTLYYATVSSSRTHLSLTFLGDHVVILDLLKFIFWPFEGAESCWKADHKNWTNRWVDYQSFLCVSVVATFGLTFRKTWGSWTQTINTYISWQLARKGGNCCTVTRTGVARPEYKFITRSSSASNRITNFGNLLFISFQGELKAVSRELRTSTGVSLL